jgi:protein subunit release factor A
VMQGDMDEVLNTLMQEYQAEQLTALSDD